MTEHVEIEQKRPPLLLRVVRRHPNLWALAFGLFLTLLVLLLAELAARAAGAFGLGHQPKNWHYVYQGEPLTVPDEVLGFAPRKNATTKITRRSPTELLYTITASTDAAGRRITPHEPGPRSKTALFFGCSFTFGEGVFDGETLPAQFAHFAPEYKCYNYAYMGYAPQHFYLQLDQPALFVDIPKPVDLVVYGFIPHHIERLVGRMRISARWGADMPCLVEEAGDIRHLGSFRNSGLLRQYFYNAADKLKLLEMLHVNLPMHIGSKHEAFAAQVLAAAGEKVKNRFPHARFIVLMYPRETGVDTAAKAFEAQGLEVVRLENSLPSEIGTGPEYNLPDLHPTAKAHQLVAEALAKYLEREEG